MAKKSAKPALLASMDEDEAELAKLLADENEGDDNESGSGGTGSEGTNSGDNDGTGAADDNGGDEDDGENTGEDPTEGEGAAEGDAAGSESSGQTVDDAKPKTNQEWAEIRRKVADRRTAQEAAKMAADAAARATGADPKPGADDPEPNKADNYEQWLEWARRQDQKQIADTNARLKEIEARQQKADEQHETTQLRQRAMNELVDFEKEAKTRILDYDAVAQNGFACEARRYMNLNPGVSQDDILAYMKDYTIKMGAYFAGAGVNPADGFYHYFSETYGKPAGAPAAKDDKGAKPGAQQLPQRKPDLKRLDTLRRKSATGMQGGQNSGSVARTKENMAEAPLSELADLSPADWRELESYE